MWHNAKEQLLARREMERSIDANDMEKALIASEAIDQVQLQLWAWELRLSEQDA